MDFTSTEAADDLAGLVRTITDSVCTSEHQCALDELDERFDATLWKKLIAADVVSATAPESLGGGGFGALEQTAVLAALGRQMAAVPYLESAVLGAGALGTFGSEKLQNNWALPAVGGDKILSVALDGDTDEEPPHAAHDGDSYHLTGNRTQVGYGPLADAFLVAAGTDSGAKVFLVAAQSPGLTIRSLSTTGLGCVGHLELDDVHVGDDCLVGGEEVQSCWKLV